MNASAFRHLYDYHFTENRKLWALAAGLSEENFARPAAYSHGSVRDQVIHLVEVENIWFSELQNRELDDPFPAEHLESRAAMRAYWDQIEQDVRAYLAALMDDMLLTTPILEPDEDRGLYVWQVLLHVVNHATDHRAQLLRQLNDLGVETGYQDYIFYCYGHPWQQG